MVPWPNDSDVQTNTDPHSDGSNQSTDIEMSFSESSGEQIEHKQDSLTTNALESLRRKGGEAESKNDRE